MTASIVSPSPLSPLVDERRVGSAGGQALIGIAGIVLAIILVVGQLSLATTKGMAVHLEESVANITDGNVVMEQVIERAAPSAQLTKVLAQQAKTLQSTSDAMARTNAELATIGGTSDDLQGIVAKMERQGASLAGTVAEMDATTAKITKELGTLPTSTGRTSTAMGAINTDMASINAELGALSKKLQKYGLPKAAGAKVG
ncbi:MAG: hypothetical protein JWO69_710 [Thermoleophilia bacterium]|jgi:chromosome segregation ATPase|nr:hypothetical protein [Thermoleophilia bacterium]